MENYAYGLWQAVAVNTVLFVFFAVTFVRPKHLVEWRTMGIFVGFVVALFTEMYGVPLTIYLLSQWLGNAYPVLNPFTHTHGHLWLVAFGLADSGFALVILHVVSNGIIVGGFVLLYHGWRMIYQSGGMQLVTGGVYAYVRHPQYCGLFLITLGLLVQWPTLLSLIMWPILLVAYSHLAKREDLEIARRFPDQFKVYRSAVPAFLPRSYGTRKRMV